MPDIEATKVGETPVGKCPECSEWCALDEIVGKPHLYELEHCSKRYALCAKPEGGKSK